jgi:hypothetical protein
MYIYFIANALDNEKKELKKVWNEEIEESPLLWLLELGSSLALVKAETGINVQRRYGLPEWLRTRPSGYCSSSD